MGPRLTPDDLPPEVAASLARYLAVADRLAPGLIEGLHVIGSVALGDYRPGRSDVDVAAVVRRPPDAAQRRALVRAQLAARGEGGPALDGLYLTADDLARPPEETAPGWWTRHGPLHGPSMEMRNPVVWTELARHAVRVRGPPVAGLVPADARALDAWCRANLRGYWRAWTARARPLDALGLLPPSWTAWGALGVSRLHRTLATGDIVSKTEAGRWAIERFPEHRPTLQLALDHRAGRERARVRPRLIRLMRAVAADALRLPPAA